MLSRKGGGGRFDILRFPKACGCLGDLRAEFFANNAELPGGIDADSDTVRPDPDNCDFDVFADQNSFARFPRQDEHDVHSFGGAVQV